MAGNLTRFPRWFWSGNKKEKEPTSTLPSLNLTSGLGLGLGLGLRDRLRIPTGRIVSRSKWKKGEEDNNIDGDYHVVLSSDEVYLSGLEADDPEWSIGWVEPHGPDFRSRRGEDDGGFVVLVPCYRHGGKGVGASKGNHLLSAVNNISNGLSPGGKSSMNQWLSSL